MSRYDKTKSDMLKLISQRKDTLSEISSELGFYFGVNPNGTLSAYSWGIPNAWNNKGFALALQYSMPFNYNAATGSSQGHTLRNIINGGAYKIVVFTSNGIMVYTRNSSAVHCGD
jgi:hypothetical protein